MSGGSHSIYRFIHDSACGDESSLLASSSVQARGGINRGKALKTSRLPSRPQHHPSEQLCLRSAVPGKFSPKNSRPSAALPHGRFHSTRHDTTSTEFVVYQVRTFYRLSTSQTPQPKNSEHQGESMCFPGVSGAAAISGHHQP